MSTMAAKFFSISSSANRSPSLSSHSDPTPLFNRAPFHSWPPPERGVHQHVLIPPPKCLSERRELVEAKLTSPLTSIKLDRNDWDISAYRWCAALGGIGFFETAYLTYLKVTGSDAFCLVGEGSCNTVLTSDYSSILGVPLPLFGMLSYGLVAFLGMQLGRKKWTSDSTSKDGEILLLGLTTTMAVASAYLLRVMKADFDGEICLYCLSSAALSFILFLISLKTFGFQELQKQLGSKLTIATLVMILLTASYNTAQSSYSSLAATEWPYAETEITTESTPFAVDLAKHLNSIGAKLYGAFWCSHCQAQKQMFGQEASKLLDYVECYPDGIKKGTTMAQACKEIELTGFPTWVIKGKVLGGQKQLSELAVLSGLELKNSATHSD